MKPPVQSTAPCPQCGDPAAFSKKRGRYFCAECELEFDAPAQAVEPQTIFLSYAHRSEREEDFDVSEELVLLIQAELQRDGHTVWIDKDGIRAGSQWRERITAAILEHAHFLSFLSTRSVRDPGVCLNEIAIALGHGKNIQTVLAQDERRVSPPLTISHIQWHDFQHWREIRAGTKTGPMGEDWDTWFGQRMAGVRETLTNAQNARVNGELQKLRDILEPRCFEARIVEKTANFHGRQWLFDATQSWLDNSTSRMFWLKGSPGVGKSAFAAMLAHRARSAVIGFFMCDFQGRKDPEESAREAICTLAFQIASRLPDYRLKLLYEMRLDKDKIDINRRGESRSSDDLFEFLITEPLNRSGKIPESTRLCLVIDALDEAGRNGGGNALADLLAKHAERLPEWLGVLVTSRPEPYLEQILKTLSGTVVDGQSAQNRQDLADWIDQRLPQSLQGQDRHKVIEAVLEKSDGTFLYLSLIEKDKTLSLADPTTLPDKLDGFFKQTFNRYFPDVEQYGMKTEPFLRLMAAAPGPLPAEMGRQILGWGQRELALNVTEPLGSLIQERVGLVPFHSSMRDWLSDAARSGTHCVDSNGAHLLGEFLWKELNRCRKNSESPKNWPYSTQIFNWLPRFALLHDISDLNFTVVDVETTGLRQSYDRITKIDATKVSANNTVVMESFSLLVNPEVSIPSEIAELTGISDEMVRSAPKIDEALRMLAEFTQTSILVGHNAMFSRNFLNAAAASVSNEHFYLPWVCTLKLSRRFFPKAPCSLYSLCNALKILTDESIDSVLEAKLFVELRKKVQAERLVFNEKDLLKPP